MPLHHTPQPTCRRRVSAPSNTCIVPTCCNMLVYLVLPYLLPLVVAPDPRLRHGALHAVAEVTSSLYSLHSHSLPALLGEGLVQQLMDVVPQVMM